MKILDPLMGVFFLVCGVAITAFMVISAVVAVVEGRWEWGADVTYGLFAGVMSLLIGVKWFRRGRS
jgi:hypothetical protein